MRIEKMRLLREKQRSKWAFMQKRVILRAFSTLTILCLYLCKKKHILILMIFKNLFLELLFFCCRDIKMYFLIVFLVVYHPLKIHEENVKAIKEWLAPKSIINVRSFHDLTSFDRRFVKDFNILSIWNLLVLNRIVDKSMRLIWLRKVLFCSFISTA